MNVFFSIALTVFFVIDAFGHIPIYLAFLKKVDKKKIRWVAARELIFAFAIMVLFHYVGQFLLSLLDITTNTVRVSGGIILFLIAIRLIFSNDENRITGWKESATPFVVPIATPLIAGPSVLSVIMIYAKEQPSDLLVLGAIFVAWFFSSLIYFFASQIYKLVGEKTLMASQRLMGMIVALIAIQMLLQGVEGLMSQTIG